jgi:hypothetical protein
MHLFAPAGAALNSLIIVNATTVTLKSARMQPLASTMRLTAKSLRQIKAPHLDKL